MTGEASRPIARPGGRRGESMMRGDDVRVTARSTQRFSELTLHPASTCRKPTCHSRAGCSRLAVVVLALPGFEAGDYRETRQPFAGNWSRNYRETKQPATGI